MHDEPDKLDLLLRDPLPRQMLLQRIAALRRVAKPERLDRPPSQSAIAQVGPRLGAIGALQLILEEGVASSITSMSVVRCSSRRAASASGWRHGNARKTCNLLDRFREADPFKSVRNLKWSPVTPQPKQW